MPPRRPRFRPPGVKPWTRIGPLGPFRGRLGLAWVVAPLVLGVVIAGAAWFIVFRGGAPGGSFEPVGPASSFTEGTARDVGIPGVFVGRTGGRLFAVRQEDGCSLGFCAGRYVDCRGATYGLDGEAPSGAGALDLLPVVISGGQVYVDPDHPVDHTPAPAPAAPAATCP
jgi:hypothetical protein